MTHRKAEIATPQYNPVFQALANERRREIISILGDCASSVDIEELAFQLVAAEQEKPLLDVADEEVEKLRASLWHIQLPVLEDAGLVAYDDEARTVTTTDHPALEDPKVTAMIETDASDWDDVLACLADKRRRIMLTALYRNTGPMKRIELATEVTEKVQGDSGTTVTVKDVLQEIHHVHLPTLEAAGLITYDDGEETISYEGHLDLDEEWLVAGANDTPHAILSLADHSADIWTLEGR